MSMHECMCAYVHTFALSQTLAPARALYAGLPNSQNFGLQNSWGLCAMNSSRYKYVCRCLGAYLYLYV